VTDTRNVGPFIVKADQLCVLRLGNSQHGWFALMIDEMYRLAAQHVKMYLDVSSAAKTNKSFHFM
jgi:hypothetical protein